MCVYFLKCRYDSGYLAYKSKHARGVSFPDVAARDAYTHLLSWAAAIGRALSNNVQLGGAGAKPKLPACKFHIHF